MRLSTAALLIIVVVGLMTAVAIYRPSPTSEWTKIILKSDSTYYYLGRNAGTLAYATLELRQTQTGRDFSIKELYALADSMSDFHTQIAIDRQILKGAK